jgi:hypothetical protein
MIKKIIAPTTLLVLILLGVMHYRIPFVIKECKGPWSIGLLNSHDLYDFKRVIAYDSLNAITNNTVFAADVFGVNDNGRAYLFFEHSQGATLGGGANIDVIALDENLNWQHLGLALEETFHLSYPQVFQDGGSWYMIPESQGSNSVRLYTTDSFPFAWYLDTILIDNIKIKDPTLILEDEVYYIFGSDQNFSGRVYYATNLRGPWKVHPATPYWMGNKTRNGGRAFKENGKWYMPMQDLAGGYGWGIYIRELLHLDTLSVQVGKDSLLLHPIDHPYFNGGMHHYDKSLYESHGIVIIDGNTCKDERWVWRFKFSLKFNLLDFRNALGLRGN